MAKAGAEIGLASEVRSKLELLLDLAVEEPLDRVRSVGIVTLIGAVADESQRRMGISEVLDTKREGHIVQQASPGPTMSFGGGCDGLFADDPAFLLCRSRVSAFPE